MRTIPEFAAACRDHDRYLRGMIAFIVAWWGCGGFAISLLMDRIEPPLTDLFGAGWDKVTAIALGLVVVYLPAFPVARWADRRMGRIPGVNCPACGKAVAHPAFREWAVATQCCPHCHVRLLAEPDPGPDVPLRSMAEVEAADRTGMRRAVGWLAGAFGALFIGTQIYAGLTEWIGGGRQKGLFVKATNDPYTAALLDLAAILLLAFVPFIVGSIRFLVLYRRAERQPAVRCPHCDGRLRPLLLQKTGNCGHCGRLAVSRTGESGTMSGTNPGAPL